ncbi:MAG TPA: hypothetical protein VN643_26015 [Pyrinomonadaceae bacterium]|nr:hypothetical protein [Pyrinomonadaceae bacterium]
MAKRIAILGWGSLLREDGGDFDRWRDEWRFDGPCVKIEFSRISKTRLGALTLVVDIEDGVTNTVAWCMSKRKSAQDAVADLGAEKVLKSTRYEAWFPAIRFPMMTAKTIAVWATSKKLDVVVWTGLPSNFSKKLNQPVSLEAAVAYLKRLPLDGKLKAAEYIWRAPDFVTTPLRAAMQVEPWFGQD